MTEPPRDLSDWMEIYRRRAGLDRLRAVLDEGDVDGRKNGYIDLVERVHLGRALGRRHRLVVDLGCGAGRLTQLLAERGAAVAALDRSEPMLRAVRIHGAPPNVRLVCADARAIPVRTGAADVVVTSNVLIHLLAEDEIAAAARETARVLRPGGRALLVEHLAPQATEHRQGIVYRSLEALVAPFQAAGLVLRSARALRKMPSFLVHLVRRGYIPRALWGAAARIEPWHARTGSPPEYSDFLVHLVRGDAAGAGV